MSRASTQHTRAKAQTSCFNMNARPHTSVRPFVRSFGSFVRTRRNEYIETVYTGTQGAQDAQKYRSFTLASLALQPPTFCTHSQICNFLSSHARQTHTLGENDCYRLRRRRCRRRPRRSCCSRKSSVRCPLRLSGCLYLCVLSCALLKFCGRNENRFGGHARRRCFFFFFSSWLGLLHSERCCGVNRLSALRCR